MTLEARVQVVALTVFVMAFIIGPVIALLILRG